MYLADIERAGGVQQGPRGGGGGDLPASHLQAQLDQGQIIHCCGMWIRIRTRIRIRIQEGKNDGFSSNLDVLYGGLGISKIQFLIKKDF
jgi:hypothetical protein